MEYGQCKHKSYKHTDNQSQSVHHRMYQSALSSILAYGDVTTITKSNQSKCCLIVQSRPGAAQTDIELFFCSMSVCAAPGLD